MKNSLLPHEQLLYDWKNLAQDLAGQDAKSGFDSQAAQPHHTLSEAIHRLVGLLKESNESQVDYSVIRETVRTIQQAVRTHASLDNPSDDTFHHNVLELCIHTLDYSREQYIGINNSFQYQPHLLYNTDLLINGKTKRIRVFSGDLTATEATYDVVACSSFKGDYIPVQRTLIGSLWNKQHISVSDLSVAPALDLRSMGCWLSKETGNPRFHRVACIELLDYHKSYESGEIETTMLKSAFSTLRFLLEQAEIHGVTVKHVALPVLGAGAQGIDLHYIIPPLVSQCLNALQQISSLEQIDFYEYNENRAFELKRMIEEVMNQNNVSLPEIFISYSSKQTNLAHQLKKAIINTGLNVWIAPESISPGSNYQEEIPTAINGARLIMLLFSEDAQRSKWVQKEVGSAIGAGKMLLPLQLTQFPITAQFRFLLEGEQIFPIWNYNEKELDGIVADKVQNKLKMRSPSFSPTLPS